MKDEHIIEKVVIDVKERTIKVISNGKDIPEQTHKFKDEDEWFDIKDVNGDILILGNVWWDEQWGFQFASYETLQNGNTQVASDYMNPNTIEFVDDDNSPFYSDEEKKDMVYYKKMKVKSLIKGMFKQTEKELDTKIDKIMRSGVIDMDTWDEDINPMIVPKMFMVAFLRDEAEQFSAKGTSFEKTLHKGALEIGYHL